MTEQNLDSNHSSAAKLIGTKLDERYEILSVLGSGASSVVYKGKHLLLDQFVAIKVVQKDQLDTEKALQRFRTEATMLSSFTHPNIVRFHAFGSNSYCYYMVLEFVEGNTLAQILKSKTALSVDEAMTSILEICEGLSYAHSKGVIHRDLKPANVIFTESNNGATTSKILDFGILKRMGNDQSLTNTGMILGSANYMSPEQCLSKELDARSDIYAMGCLIY